MSNAHLFTLSVLLGVGVLLPFVPHSYSDTGIQGAAVLENQLVVETSTTDYSRKQVANTEEIVAQSVVTTPEETAIVKEKEPIAPFVDAPIVVSSLVSSTASEPAQGSCAQVITYATDGSNCQQFSTPCNVPSGWTTVSDCAAATTGSSSSGRGGESGVGGVCAQVMTAATDSNGNCEVFTTACVPSGWTPTGSSECP